MEGLPVMGEAWAAICRKIAERHNGTLIAESEPDQGATIIFTLPIHQLKGELHNA